ncbi:TIGR00341 family protein [Chitinophaga horti]|uniref:TIGR00341 family protein n=1 Tax=Chitinophaga horti TaxID=2920382 RepID=A0ABY6JC26_9BACT|nr:TIGR00341 family protein [Chitinophaga horti]UYQ95754.1 TIGR00341 family protein [Chitinophaga horti]
MRKRKPNRRWRMLRLVISRRFNLHIDKADEQSVIRSIALNTEFKGANLWALIFAILIASIGLNVNSPAFIIGAMLISPLMGPITGVGLGIGINDFELVKKGFRNLFFATIISIATSTVYFLLTPLHEAQSELLARTTPSVWDVFIAFFGGLAGMVAATRKEKSNVIPGVAIATTLMPPLCTAGFGIANGNWYYLVGALYLYFINTVFICFSTILIVRFLRFRKKYFEDKRYEKKVSRYIFFILLITLLPSIYMAYRIVNKSIFTSNAQKFVKEQFAFRNTQVVNRNFVFDGREGDIELLLIGHEIPAVVLDSIRAQLPRYKLPDARLVVRQGLNAKQEIDLMQVKASILEDVFSRDSTLRPAAADSVRSLPDLRLELKALFPGMKSYAINGMEVKSIDSVRTDKVTMVVASFEKRPSANERLRLERWLKQRLRADTLSVVLQ